MYYLVSTYDKKGETYSTPISVKKPAIAVRDFMDVCKDEKHPFHNYPEDYSLWITGEFNEDNGTINPKREKIAEAINFVIKKEK